MAAIAPENEKTSRVQCECWNWARTGRDGFLWSHHPDCAKHDPAEEAREYIGGLVLGIEQWAADEDGIPEHLRDAYCRAVFALGRPWPKRNDDASE